MSLLNRTHTPTPIAVPAVTTDDQPITDLLARLERWLGQQPDVRAVQDLGGGAVQVTVAGVGPIWLTVTRSGQR